MSSIVIAAVTAGRLSTLTLSAFVGLCAASFAPYTIKSVLGKIDCVLPGGVAFMILCLLWKAGTRL
jgi:hypothetical protein